MVGIRVCRVGSYGRVFRGGEVMVCIEFSWCWVLVFWFLGALWSMLWDKGVEGFYFYSFFTREFFRFSWYLLIVFGW